MFAIFRNKGGYCYYCGKEAETLDHVNPRHKGGSSEDNNLVPACRRCNRLKGGRSLEAFKMTWTRKMNNMPKFSSEHIEFLNRYNIKLPEFDNKFWYETQGLKI
jgi:5-methylcytosine-specific restriction endonuclease McrA